MLPAKRKKIPLSACSSCSFLTKSRTIVRADGSPNPLFPARSVQPPIHPDLHPVEPPLHPYASAFPETAKRQFAAAALPSHQNSADATVQAAAFPLVSLLVSLAAQRLSVQMLPVADDWKNPLLKLPIQLLPTGTNWLLLF